MTQEIEDFSKLSDYDLLLNYTATVKDSAISMFTGNVIAFHDLKARMLFGEILRRLEVNV